MKIVIDNLPPDTTEEQLRELFAQIGEVESVEIRLNGRIRMRSRGYVDMPLDVDAYRAVQCLNGTPIKDRHVDVAEVRSILTRAKNVFRLGLSVITQRQSSDQKASTRLH